MIEVNESAIQSKPEAKKTSSKSMAAPLIKLSVLIAGVLLSGCVHSVRLADLKPETAELTIWLIGSKKGEMELVPVKRGILGGNRLESAVKSLIDGPLPAETSAGLGSEIPLGTVLLGIKEQNDAIELNLSRRFAQAGGIESVETRLEQLSRTIKSLAEKKPVYLNIEGERLTMTQGDGIEIKQPINK